MREIKFRAWDGKQMHENVAIVDGVAYKREYFANIFSENAKAGEPMQFTGLYDKNGKEIYEGDIVRHATDEGIYKVIFEEGGFYVKNLFEYDFQTINEYPLEVIGNIYENPQLLEGVE